MAKITQEQLIEKLQTLKEIKPNKEWVSLLKSQILAEKPAEVVISQNANFVSIKEVFSSVFFQPFGTSQVKRKMAYSLAVFAFMVVGILGFAQGTMPGDLLFPIKKITEQSQAVLTGQTKLNQDVVSLNNRINDLAFASRSGKTSNMPSAISEIANNASDLVKVLKDNTQNNPETIKEIASSLKVLASVQGTDLTENSEVQSLYQAVVESQIADLEKATLTKEQKIKLTEIKALYEKGKYSQALEEILTISN